MRFLVTGTAGFIGFHVARRLLSDGHSVVGFDGLTTYYDVRLKRARNAMLTREERFKAHHGMLEDLSALERAAADADPEVIIHLAAQAGVRYSLENPRAYVDSNLIGSFNVLEIARQISPKHLLLASTSSAYGANDKMPFSESDKADHPITLYAATKKAMEVISHSYSHLWGIPTTCFRFFTVYGPWGRPDMAPIKFVENILNEHPIDIYGNGEMKRDFTYIDDLVEAIVRLVPEAPRLGEPLVVDGVQDTLSPVAPWRLVNIAGGNTTGLMEFIGAVERALGKRAMRNYMPMQKGDVPATYGDHKLLEGLTGYRPATTIQDGVSELVRWYQQERQTNQ